MDKLILCLVLLNFLVAVQVLHTPAVSAEADMVTTQEPISCGMKKADIVFALDGSYSIWPPHFRKQVDFVIKFINSFDIAYNQTRVAVTMFGTYVRLVYHLYHYSTAARMTEVLTRLRQVGGSSTNTGEAIRYMRQECFRRANGDRREAVNIGIVITDGASQDWRNTVQQARLARNGGIHMFAVGVGDANKINVTELVNIASAPRENYVFRVDNYDVLESIRHLLTDRTCQVTNVPTPAPRTTTPKAKSTKRQEPSTEIPATRAEPKIETTEPKSEQTTEGPREETTLKSEAPKETPARMTTVAAEEATAQEATTKKTENVTYPTKPSGFTRKSDLPTKPFLDILPEPKSEDRKDGNMGDHGRPRSTSSINLLPACGTNVKIDIMFVMPSTASINNTNKALRFYSDLSSRLDVADDKVRVGLVPGYCAEMSPLQLNSYYAKDALAKKLKSMELQGDDIASKLRHLRTHSFTDCEGHRPGVRKAVVIIIDRQADDLCDVVLEAVAARRDGIHIFVIAVGGDKVALEAEDIASHPIKETIFHINSYLELPKITAKVWMQLENYCWQDLP